MIGTVTPAVILVPTPLIFRQLHLFFILSAANFEAFSCSLSSLLVLSNAFLNYFRQFRLVANDHIIFTFF